MNGLNSRKRLRGLTLIELMVVVAIIAVIAGIAIPAYNGYIREAKLGTAKINAESIRIFLEDFQLDNGTYRVTGAATITEAQLYSELGWSADGDADATNDDYTYSVEVTDNTYHIVVTHLDGDWVRCEDRMANCCSGKSGQSSASCP